MVQQKFECNQIQNCQYNTLDSGAVKNSGEILGAVLCLKEKITNNMNRIKNQMTILGTPEAGPYILTRYGPV